MEIPLFPLHAVLAPGSPLPLHIFEPRYRALVADCLAAGAPFGVVCLSAGREVGAGSVAFAAVGTLAEIREVSRYADGRYDIVTVGTSRFRLSGVVADRKPYLVGIGELLPEIAGDEERTARLARRVRSRFVRYLELLQPEEDEDDEGAEGEADADEPEVTIESSPEPGSRPTSADDAAPPVDPDRAAAALAALEEIAARLAPPDDPAALAHVVSGLVQVELPRRQRLLEASTTEERLADLDALLGQEIALLARRLGPYAPDPRLLALRRN
jgi:Lon protease-like protein